MQPVPAEPTKHTLTEHITKILCDSHDGMHLNFNGGRLRWGVASGIAELIAAAAEAHYRPKIETVEQLDALGLTALVRDLNGETWEKRTYLSGLWDCLSEDGNGGLRTPPLPAIVLWSPGGAE